MLRLRTFGGLLLEDGGRPGAGAAGQRAPLAILAFIAAAAESGVSRDRITALFWPESDTERARGSLKQALYQLRRAVGGHDLTIGNTTLQLNPDVVSADVSLFSKSISTRAWESAAEQYTGVFLDGVHLAGNIEFEHWVERERNRLAHDHLSALEALAAAAEADGKFTAAAEWWRRAAAADMLSARIARSYMEALAQAGDREAAIKHAHVYQSIVRSELETEPDPQIAQLADRLRSHRDTLLVRAERTTPGTERPVATTSVAITVPPPYSESPLPEVRPSASSWRRPVLGFALVSLLTFSAREGLPRNGGSGFKGSFMANGAIAVLPCGDATGNDTTGAGDRWAEELTAKLLRIEGVRLRSWTSASRYHDTPLSNGRLGQELNAGAIVRCRIDDRGDSARFKVEVVRATDDALVWMGQYAQSRQVQSINDMQADAARDIAKALGVGVSATAFKDVARPMTQDSVALLMYRMGRYFADTWNTGKAIEYFEKAIARDSGFALAHAALASALLFDAEVTGAPSGAYYPRMGTLLRKSIELDPSIATPHTWMGFYLLNFTHDFAGAEAEHRRAIALEPNSSDPYVWYGWHLFQVDRLDDAIPVFRRAVDLDPASVLALGHLIRALNYTGKRKESLRLVKIGLQMRPDWEPFTHHYASLLIQHGFQDSAVRVLDRESGPGNWAPRGWLYAQAGRPDRAREMLRDMTERNRSKQIDPVLMAWLEIALGNERAALDLMERGYAERSNLLLMLLGPHPAFDPLRDNPRFIELRKKAGFPLHDSRRKT